MSLISPQQVSDGTSIVASNVNNPINTIANDYNGNITDANISASAAIGGSKIATASIPTTSLINDWQQNYIISGGVIAVSSGLVGTFTNVTLVIDGYKLTLSSVPNKTYTASKDTYVDVLRTGTTPSIVYTEVANNAASPALAASSIRVGVVVSSGAALTVINQGSTTTTGPTVSSSILAVCDSLGNLIYPCSPSPVLLGYRQITSNFAPGSLGPVQVTGLSLPVIIPTTNRRVKVTFYAPSLSNGSAARGMHMSIWDGVVNSGTQLQDWQFDPYALNAGCGMNQEAIVQASGSKTYNAGYSANTGGDAVTISASSTKPAFIQVELV